MTVFTDMAMECINGLDLEERQSIPESVLTKIIHICAEYAEANMGSPPTVGKVPCPPATQPIRAAFLAAGDFVWRHDFAFDVVEAATRDGAFISVLYTDDHVDLLEPDHLKRVAVNRREADEWNLNRVLFTADTLEALAAVYGTYTV